MNSHRTISAAALLLVLSLPGCTLQAPAPSPSPRAVAAIPGAVVLERGERQVADVPTADVHALATSRNGFALDLYRRLAQEEGNLALGPDSISNALMMTLAGARGNTAAEMRATLGLTLDDDAAHAAAGALDASLLAAGEADGIDILRATRVFGQAGFPFHDEYLETLSRDYGAPLATLDFGADPEAAREVINAWVSEQTRELIEELMPRGTVHALTRLVLVDAQYLKAAWEAPFDPELTQPAPFHVSPSRTREVDMMSHHLEIPVASGPGWVAGELPYAGDRLAMLVVVPENLAAFEAVLDGERFADIAEGLDEDAGYIPVRLPRFEIETHSSLVQPLQELGISDLFGPADLSGITSQHAGLYVEAVEHEAVVKVNEEGTEAAAATGVAIPASAPLIELSADRPFLFFVRDRETGAILFMGRVADPTAK